MLNKIKNWLMTDENKEKKQLEKEKKERELKREGGSNSTSVKERIPKDKKQRNNSNKSKEDSVSSKEDISNLPNNVKEPKKKIVKKVVRRNNPTEQDEELLKFEQENKNAEIKHRIENNSKNKEDTKSDNFPNDKLEKVEEAVEDDSYLKGIQDEFTQNKKLEMAKKKQDEKEKWMGIMIDLPPTSDPDIRIQYALAEGVPEWYLREGGYIVDDVITADEIFNFSSSLSEEEMSLEDLEKEKLGIKEEHVEDDDKSAEVVTSKEEKESSMDVEDIVIDKESSIAVEDIVSDKESGIVVDIISDKESSIAVDIISDKESSIAVEDIVIDKEISTLDDSITKEEIVVDDIPAENESMDKEVLNRLRERLKQFNISQDTENLENLPFNLEERLANVKMRREVINKEGTKLLVKEVLDIDGETKSQYKSYNVSEDEAFKVNVGEDIDDTVKLEHLEESIIIDGEYYDLSEEEEIALLNQFGVREIWLLTTDRTVLEKALINLKDSRYIPKLIESERDFLLATRSVNNVILFSMSIPDGVKKSVSSFLKYLRKENKRARLITSEYSKVNSKVIEHVVSEITVEELNTYFDKFDYSLYSEIKKSLVDLYRVISFDLTDSFGDDLIIELDSDESIMKDKGDKAIEIFNPVPIELKEEDPLDRRSNGDVEISFSDTILITDDKNMFKKGNKKSNKKR